MGRALEYAKFLLAFCAAEGVSMWGQFFTLKYPNMNILTALFKALPFAWLDWFLLTIAVGIGEKNKLVTPTQDTFLVIITQFTWLLIINRFWLKQPVTKSDAAAFVTILVGFWISFARPVSKLLGYPLRGRVGKKRRRRNRHRAK